MAICVIKTNKQLGINFVLTPERYNPKRRMNITSKRTIRLSEIIELSNDTITVKQGQNMDIVQINTSDAMGGYLNINTTSNKNINSNKKVLKKGDVIISRLRPYLKQVAYVDGEIENAILGASTEFYVLRSRTEESIAFLVPFLLSDVAQVVFANSVEGSQHPRFKEDDVLNLELPIDIYMNREEISSKIIEAIKSYRVYENSIREEIFQMNKAI
ncbi:MAG: hypothetical protein NC416_02720 [Eubacterium sp.]|nr:hypothetical protein [Eubacterium sp.]